MRVLLQIYFSTYCQQCSIYMINFKYFMASDCAGVTISIVFFPLRPFEEKQGLSTWVGNITLPLKCSCKILTSLLFFRCSNISAFSVLTVFNFVFLQLYFLMYFPKIVFSSCALQYRIDNLLLGFNNQEGARNEDQKKKWGVF